jgi:hypothetical protein
MVVVGKMAIVLTVVVARARTSYAASTAPPQIFPFGPTHGALQSCLRLLYCDQPCYLLTLRDGNRCVILKQSFAVCRSGVSMT